MKAAAKNNKDNTYARTHAEVKQQQQQQQNNNSNNKPTKTMARSCCLFDWQFQLVLFALLIDLVVATVIAWKPRNHKCEQKNRGKREIS